MIISNLDHLEEILPPIAEGTSQKIDGGFTFIFTQGFANASGSVAAIVATRTQAVTFSYPVLAPPIFLP